jgi:hypothetical protein
MYEIRRYRERGGEIVRDENEEETSVFIMGVSGLDNTHQKSIRLN